MYVLLFLQLIQGQLESFKPEGIADFSHALSNAFQLLKDVSKIYDFDTDWAFTFIMFMCNSIFT